MKRAAFLSIAVSILLVSGPLAAAEDFGEFLQRFFNDRAFQLERIQFPFVKDELLLGEGIQKIKIQKSEWKHLLGPEHLRCKKDCFDIVVYDNFELKMRDTGKRVLSYEGLGNGIKEAFYFQLLNGKWVLVKWENLSS